MEFCLKCRERPKPDDQNKCQHCIRGIATRRSIIIFFLVIFIGAFFIYSNIKDLNLPTDSFISIPVPIMQLFIDYSAALNNYSHTDWAADQFIYLISIAIAAVILAAITYVFTLKRNLK